MPSIERRLARFVANRRIVVGEVWKQFLEQVLPYWQGTRLYLVLDGCALWRSGVHRVCGTAGAESCLATGMARDAVARNVG